MYNEDHMHNGLNLLTPSMIHSGRVQEIVNARQQVMEQAFVHHPERFSRGGQWSAILIDPAAYFCDVLMRVRMWPKNADCDDLIPDKWMDARAV